MGSMSAMLHVVTVGAGGSLDELWDLAEELNGRINAAVTGANGNPGLHSFAPSERSTTRLRYCFHPNSDPAIEFRSDDQHDAVLQGCMWLAKCLEKVAPEDVWRRD